MAFTLPKEKWNSKPLQIKKMIQWRIHSVSEVRHLSTWTSLCISIETPIKNILSIQKDENKSSNSFSCCEAFKWKISLWSDGTDLFTRVNLLSPENCILTYKVNVKIGRNGQLPLCPAVALPREISTQSQSQMWKVLSLEQLCSSTNGLISEDSVEFFIELTSYGSIAEELDNNLIQSHPDFMRFITIENLL